MAMARPHEPSALGAGPPRTSLEGHAQEIDVAAAQMGRSHSV